MVYDVAFMVLMVVCASRGGGSLYCLAGGPAQEVGEGGAKAERDDRWNQGAGVCAGWQYTPMSSDIKIHVFHHVVAAIQTHILIT